MSNDLRWQLGSDFHIPYENPRYMKIWWDVMDWFAPDVVEIVGDLDDACPVSKFSDGRPEEVMGAITTYAPLVQKFFQTAREKCSGQIYFHTGNHEKRYDEYIDRKAPALRDFLTPEMLWKTDTYGIELSFYDNPPVHRFGDIFCHHGLYVSKNSGDSVRKMVDEFGVSIVSGHSHRQAYAPRTYELRNETLRAWEIGHMTDISSPGMGYAAHHPWQAGFAIGHIVNDYPHIQLVSINEAYECVVDGKVFRG